MKKLQIEQDAATKRAAELEKQLQLASSAESTKFSIYFANLEAQYQQMNSLAEEMEKDGKTEEANKLLSALEKGLQMMIDNLKK